MSNPPKESIEAGEWKRSTNFMEHPVFHRWSCICDTLHDLVPFVQFKKREKHPWRNVTFTNKSNTHLWVLLTFFKMCKWYQTSQRTTRRLYFHVIFADSLERAARIALVRLYTKSFSLTYTRTKCFYLINKPNKHHAVF